jgi:GNAT superfamily N-acetyltransferase
MVKIRPAKSEDAQPVARIVVEYFPGGDPRTMPEEIFLQRKEQRYEESTHHWRQIIEEIEQGLSPLSCLYVAENTAGEVIGFSYACPSKDEARPEDVGELDMLYIQEKHQRRGIGRALVQVTAAYMAHVGMTKLHICTPTDHTQGRRFYDKLGGKVISTRIDYDDDEVIPLVVYEWADLQELVNMEAQIR